MDIDAQAAAGTEDLGARPAPGGQSDLAADLAAAQALADERYQELQYARAEIDNVRKRAERAALDRLTFARRKLLEQFLPVLDNLQRALAFDDSEGLRGGLQATLRGFEGVLTREGVVPLETVGKPFDPHVAEAIATRESSEYPDDVVLEEAQRGYRMGDDVLRPALVVVAKRTEPPAEADASAIQE